MTIETLEKRAYDLGHKLGELRMLDDDYRYALQTAVSDDERAAIQARFDAHNTETARIETLAFAAMDEYEAALEEYEE